MTAKQKPSILIVDDDKFLLDMYAIKFVQSDFDVTTALGSLDALTRLREGLAPDVIVTDVLMPAMDGFEFLEILMKEKLGGKAKTIVLSNKGEKSDIDRGIALGASGYIVKASAIPSEVVAKVREILKIKN